MLDIQILRKDLNTVIEQLANRGFNFPKAQFIALEESRKDIQVKTETLQAMRNQLSKQIGLLKSQKQNADALMQEVNQVNIELELNKTMLEEIQKQLGHILLNIPNLADASVPVGQDETQNQCVHSWGEPKTFVNVKDHADLGALLGLDFDTAAKLSGARFSILKGKIATLHRALVQFMLNNHINNGYTEMYVPYLVNGKSMQGTGQLPKFEEDLFKLGKIGASDENFYLIPTAEVPLTNTVADTIQDSDTLPIKMVAHTPCFRSEAGSHGRDTKGMIRQHQFDKVELVQIVKPEDSMQALEALVTDAENILKALPLPF
jgi:seryl-tRNA synthetase